MLEGWIAIHRLMQEWEWWDDPIMVKVWIQFLFDANIADNCFKGTPVMRGQLVFGRKAYAKKCSVSEQQIRTVVTRLKSTNEITIKSTKMFSVITISKYEDYQSPLKISTNTSTNTSTYQQPTINQQSTTLEQVTNKIDQLKRPETSKSTFRGNGLEEQWRRYYDELNIALDMRKTDKTYPYPVKPEEG